MSETDRKTYREKSNRRTATVFAGFLAASTLIVVLFVWKPWLADSERLFEHAQSVRNGRPEEAERLLRQAIAAAGGHYGDAQVALCELMGKKQRWNDARELLSKTSLPECRPSLLMDVGREAWKSQQWDVAESVLADLQNRNCPEAREALVLLKSIYNRLGKYAEMLNCAKQLTRLAPDDPKVWWDLGATYEMMGLGADAMAAYQRVLELEIPSEASLQVRQKRLSMLLESGETTTARVELDQLIAQHGKQADSAYFEAELCRQEGRSREALDVIERHLATSGETVRALMLRGLLRQELGYPQQAIGDFQNVIKAEPNNDLAHFKLSECHRRLGRDDLGAKHQAEYERLLKMKSEDLESKKHLRSQSVNLRTQTQTDSFHDLNPSSRNP